MDFLKRHVVRLDFDEGMVLIDGSIPPQFKAAAWEISMTLYNKRHFTKDLRQVLRTRPGEKISCEIQRDEKVVKADFVLKRFL